jgi:hypothetical protein
MARRGDWEQALASYLIECEGRPYAWGEHDCALFAAGAALAMTGVDPAAAFRGRYHSKRTAMAALRSIGAGTLKTTIDAIYAPIGIGFAQRGDWALHEGAVGVVAGAFALFVGDVDDLPGLIRVPRAAWRKAWRVE